MLKFISVALLVRMMIATAHKIISAQVQKDIFIPVVFALLPHKSRNSYDEMFVMIKDALADRGLALSAEYFMSDFEQNIVFPASSLKWNQRVCQETVPGKRYYHLFNDFKEYPFSKINKQKLYNVLIHPPGIILKFATDGATKVPG